MTLVFVICENHFDIGVVAFKSAVAYSTTRLHLIIIADKRNKNRMIEESMLPNVDAVLYADTDVIFVHPLEDFWRMFYAMNEWQMAGMAPDKEDLKKNRYLRKALHPFLQPFALNAGLLMMNLTRMRSFDLEGRVIQLNEEFKGRIPLADQDLLNIVFARYPQGIFTFTCRWNYRGEHCQGDALCADGPIAAVHASLRMLLDNPEPGFITLHRTMRNFKLGQNLVDGFILPLNESLQQTTLTGLHQRVKEAATSTAAVCKSCRLRQRPSWRDEQNVVECLSAQLY
ncbi:hypothetical protein MTO96_025260 [Rhipicephalus appendiculatus]